MDNVSSALGPTAFQDLWIKISPLNRATAPSDAPAGGGPRYSVRLELTGYPGLDRPGDCHLDLEALASDERRPEEYGRLLGQALFADETLRAHYHKAAAHASGQQRGLRVRLLLEAPELQTVRWERLQVPPIGRGDGDGWLGLAADAPVSMLIPVHGWQQPEPLAARPLRALVVIAAPEDRVGRWRLDPIDPAWVQRLRALFERLPELQVTWLASGTARPPSMVELQRALTDGYDIVYFFCHGARTAVGTVLYLERGDRSVAPVTSRGLLNCLRRAGQPPHLCMLAACESARREHFDDFVPLGPALVAHGHIPAVVAMAERVGQDSALLFTEQFCARLLAHGLVDVAVHEARQLVEAQEQKAWSIPVLFSSLADNRLVVPVVPARAAPFKAAQPGDEFVPRAAEMEAALDALLATTGGSPRAATVALCGAGGFGKTTLARAVCQDARVQQAFGDGILWVTLGEKPGDLTGRLQDLTRDLTGERPEFGTQDAAATHLAEALGDRALLLVVDDVWDQASLRPFLTGGPRCTRLITTRDRAIPPPAASLVGVDAMHPDEAVALLAAGLPEPGDAAALGSLAARLGEWPLLLKLANGTLRYRVDRMSQPLAAALAYVEQALTRRGLVAFDARQAEARGQAVARSLEASLELLTVDERARFGELAVFPEDVDVPLATVGRLWSATGGLDAFDTEELTERLAQLSLLVHFDAVTGSLRLHDVVRAYLAGLERERLPGLHAALLDSYELSAWTALPADEPYLWRHLAYHLRWAERWGELQALLLDFTWLQAKLGATGVAELIADYDHLPTDADTRFVQQALRLSAHVLARDKRQMAGQLLGRLRAVAPPPVQALLEQAEHWADAVWLRPCSASLTPPGSGLLRTLEGHTDKVVALALHPDGRRAVSGSEDGTVRVWDLEQGALLGTLEGHTKWVTTLALHPDGRRAVSGSDDGTVRVWDLEQGALLRALEGHTGWIRQIALHPDGRRAVSGSDDGTVRVWDLEQGALLRALEGHTDMVLALVLHPDGRRAVSGSADGTVRVWDLEQGALLRTLAGHRGWVSKIALLPDGRRVVSGSLDGTVRVWDLEQGALLGTLAGHSLGVSALALLPDGRRAVSDSGDGTLRVWDLEQGALLGTLEGHTKWVTTLALLPDGRRVVSGSEDGTLRVWDLEQGVALRPREGHTNSVTTLALIPDKRQTISGSEDGTVRVWDLEQSVLLRTLKGHTHTIWSLAVLPDGRRAVSGSADGTVRVWDLEQGALLRTLAGHRGWVSKIALLPDGRWVVSGSGDGTLRVWDLEQAALLRTLGGHREGVTALALLPDGQRAVSGSFDGTVRVWDLEQGALLHALNGHTAAVAAITLVPDRRRVVTGSMDGTVRVWDLEQGALLGTLEGHTKWVTTLALLPDGRRVVSGSGDGTLRVWDLEQAALLRTLGGHRKGVTALALLPDGQRAASGSVDRTLRVWDLEQYRQLAEFSGDDALVSVAASCEPSLIVAGDASGHMHFLRLESPRDTM